MPLIVHSKSTEKFIDDWTYDRTMLVRDKPDKHIADLENTENIVIAIGGGSVIDTAKILCRNPAIAVPTTFSGASRTKHAVYWYHGRKININTKKPITICKPEYQETLPKEIRNYSLCDCLCHAIEASISNRATKLSDYCARMSIELLGKNKPADSLNASFLAGDAIEITGTNVIHALSYPITSLYGISHGKALAFLLPRVVNYLYDREIEVQFLENVELDINIEKVIDEALTYKKIYESRRLVNKRILMELLK